ncbi:MAG: hypothetical protein ACK54F_12660 [Planctomycetia bacterium]|jgi:hypothetical protein
MADHVDREVVAGEDVKVGPQPVAKRKPLPLEPAGERCVLRADAVGDREQVGVGVEPEHATARHERGGFYGDAL